MGPKSAEEKRNKNTSWFVFIIVSLFYFYEFAQITVLNSLSTQIIERYKINATQLSNLSAIYFYVNVALLLPAGVMLDRYKTKTCILVAMALSISGTIIFAISHSLLTAQIGRATSGIGGAFCFISCVKYIATWIPAKKIPLAVSVLVTMGFIGGISAQIPFALINKQLGWDASLSLLVATGIICWWLILVFVKDKSTRNFTPIAHLVKSLISSLRNRQTWICGSYISLMNLPIMILATLWSNLYLEKVHHLTPINASLFSSLLIVGTAIGSPLSAAASEKIKNKKNIMMLGAILAFSTLYFIMTYKNNNTFVLANLFFLLGLFSSTQCLGYPAILENNSPKASAIVSSIASIMVLGGGATLKVLFGYLLDYSWGGKPHNLTITYSESSFEAGLNMLLLCLLASAFLALFVNDNSSEKETNS